MNKSVLCPRVLNPPSLFGLLLLALAAGAGCGSFEGESNGNGGAGGTKKTSSTGTGGSFDPSGNEVCNGKPDLTPVCTPDGAPALCSDGAAVQQAPACSNNGSFCEAGLCTCNPGDIVCFTNAAYECQIGATPGQNTYVLKEECVDPAVCVAGQKGSNAGCQFPPQCTSAGGFMCAPDGNTVLHCQPTNGFYEWVPTIACEESGFANGCVLTPEPPQSAKELCMNACNVRGVPLDSALCADVPGLFCAKFVCNVNGTKLEPDHNDCRPPGTGCNDDPDCMSCICGSNGLCFGQDDTINVCPPNDKICKDQ